jgi:hypothetical protein
MPLRTDADIDMAVARRIDAHRRRIGVVVAGLRRHLPSTRKRAAWKSIIAIWASSSEVWTHWPLPEVSRSVIATSAPIAP